MSVKTTVLCENNMRKTCFRYGVKERSCEEVTFELRLKIKKKM